MLANNQAFFYHHQSDPYIQDFQRQASKNAELNTQMTKMQSDIDTMKSTGVAQNASYLPEDVDPDIAYSQEFVETNQDKLYSAAKTKEKGMRWGWWILIALGGFTIVYLVFIRKY
jgi:hypothetical protein